MGKLFIAGNGFDIAHKMKTSYQDFYSFLELAQHVCEITKRENASLSWDNLKQDDKERIKENEWLNQFPTETIKVNIIKYLLKSNNKKKTSYKSYNAWNIYVKYMENNQLLAYLMKTRIGIEDGLVAIINQGNIKAEQLLCELIEVTRTFIYYMKIVVFECYAQEYYTMNHKRNSFTVISTYDKIAEELETTIKILNFNFTNLFDLYGKGKLNKEVNGTVKDYTLIFGVNGSVILDNGKRIDDTDYRILTKEYIKGLFHAANSQLFSGSGNDEIRELMDDIG